VTGRIGEWGEGGGLDAARGDFVTRKEMIASVFCECTGLWQQLCAQEATACDGIAPKARQAAPKLVLSVFAEFDHPGVILDESSYMLPQLKRTGQKDIRFQYWMKAAICCRSSNELVRKSERH
jgi:hypothetical protein